MTQTVLTENEIEPDSEHANREAATSLLEIKDLHIKYREGRRWSTAVRGVSLRVDAGEIVTIVGESGSGKSTVIHGALGLLPRNAAIESGEVEYSGVAVTSWTDSRFSGVRGNYIGFIPQDPGTSLNPVKRIGAQVLDAVALNDREAKSAEEQRERALESLRLAGLRDVEQLFSRYPHELSGGMKQRVLIAIALAGKPQIIVADEPTSALDVTVQRIILDHLETLRAELGIGVLLITHDLGVALDRSDRILVMEQGVIVDEGTPRELAVSPGSDYTRRLLDAAPGRHEGRLEPVRERVVVPSAADIALRARNLDKRYHSRDRGEAVHALRDVDITIRRGSTHAIVGESGAGKSTLASILAGFASADAGSVVLGDREITSLTRRELRELRRSLQLVFQNPYTSLDPSFSVGRIIAEPLRAFNVVRGRAAIRERVLELLDSVALDGALRTRAPKALSGGQRQRVAIARALALRPDVLVLDEAVSALDVSVQAQILKLLVDLQAELGLTYIFVTHDLGVVRLIADDVTVMRDGAVVETGTVESVFADPQTDYTRELLDAIPGTQLAAEER